MSRLDRFRSIEAALLRYRIMAITVGVGLLVLTFVGIPLQIFDHNKTVVDIVGPIHGYLYLAYLVTAYNLARRAHFRFGRLLIMISAGLVPFVAFIIEHRIVKGMRTERPITARTTTHQAGGTPVGHHDEITPSSTP